MRNRCSFAYFLLMFGCFFLLAACSPEVGSEQWCADMKKKPTKDWTAQNAADYTKYCVLRLEKK